MDLFNTHGVINLLPYDGEVHYYGKILSYQKAQYYFDCLLHTIPWKHDQAIIFGKTITTSRKVAWYGDQEYTYSYSKINKRALPWTKNLLELKKTIEKVASEKFNSCLLNLYHNGNEGVAWHSDDEKSLKHNASIASLSFGAEREFSFKHKKTKSSILITLETGSLLIMKKTTQTHWLHRLPLRKKIKTPRINLTFRSISQPV